MFKLDFDVAYTSNGHAHKHTWMHAHTHSEAPTHMLSHGLRLSGHKELVLRGERSPWERSDKNPRLFLCWPGPTYQAHTHKHTQHLCYSFFLFSLTSRVAVFTLHTKPPAFKSWSYYTLTHGMCVCVFVWETGHVEQRQLVTAASLSAPNSRIKRKKKTSSSADALWSLTHSSIRAKGCQVWTYTHIHAGNTQMGSPLASDPHQMLPFTVCLTDIGSIASQPTGPTAPATAQPASQPLIRPNWAGQPHLSGQPKHKMSNNPPTNHLQTTVLPVHACILQHSAAEQHMENTVSCELQRDNTGSVCLQQRVLYVGAQKWLQDTLSSNP